jgi:hypothetical protein
MRTPKTRSPTIALLSMRKEIFMIAPTIAQLERRRRRRRLPELRAAEPKSRENPSTPQAAASGDSA